MKKNCLVAQSGGPTVAINASLAGVISRALESEEIDIIYGGRNGIQGILKEDFIQLSDIFATREERNKLIKTPAMYLGSCRYKMKKPSEDESDYKRLCEIFQKYDIGYFFYIGGNDSMDTVLRLSEYAKEKGLDVKVVGVPKTIDNDLALIDHTPGFGSAAKYIATSILEMAHDTYIYDMKTVLIVEIMGRNAGWLTASAALARNENQNAPHIICLPEIPFSKAAFMKKVQDCLADSKYVIVAVSEGIRDESGQYVSSSGDQVDQFGHTMLCGTGEVLRNLISKEIGCKVRNVELNVLQRSASHISSKTDLKESENLGQKAVELALEGKNGVMAILERVSNDPYAICYGAGDIRKIANVEKKVPRSMISEDGFDVTEEMMVYLRPLILGEMEIPYVNGLPSYLLADGVLVTG